MKKMRQGHSSSLGQLSPSDIGGQIQEGAENPKSLRSESPLNEAHKTYELMLRKTLATSCARLVPVIYGAFDGLIRRLS